MVGERLADLKVPEHDGVYIQEIDRIDQRQGYFGFKHIREQQISPGPGTVIQRGDTLRVKGSKEQVEAMAERCRLVLLGPEDRTDLADADRFVSIGICELVLMSSSRLVKRKVSESGLRDQFGLTVLSIHRGEKYVWQGIKDQVMEAGDALLVQGAWSDIGKLDEFSEDWVVVGRPREHPRPRPPPAEKRPRPQGPAPKGVGRRRTG
ncbi:MAG: TrkA C-terminal domain-containing protein, partial [Planctomycetes bacterium]|nr:TrkA C-terminal domain-containing protein [Planctomycetota bacterium]